MAGREKDPLDPRELIAEAFRMEGLGSEECRSIFLDWALGLPEEAEPRAMIAELIERHQSAPPDHPMLAVLREGLDRSARRRPSRGRGDRK